MSRVLCGDEAQGLAATQVSRRSIGRIVHRALLVITYHEILLLGGLELRPLDAGLLLATTGSADLMCCVSVGIAV